MYSFCWYLNISHGGERSMRTCTLDNASKHFSFAGLVSLSDLFLLIKWWSFICASCFSSWKNCYLSGICTYSSHQSFQIPTLVDRFGLILSTTKSCLWIMCMLSCFILCQLSLFGEPRCEEEHWTFVWEVKKGWMYSP